MLRPFRRGCTPANRVRGRAQTCIVCAIACLAAWLHSATASAQSVGTNAPHSADWTRNWSPFLRAMVPSRAAPMLAPAGLALLVPEPRAGLFWTGGNPAGVPRDIVDGYAEFGLQAAGTDGDYRRPFDSADESTWQAAALAWQPVGETGGLAGSISFAETRAEHARRVLTLEPYGSVPFIVTDTAAAGHRLSRIRVEGAGGRRFGSFSAGASIGLEAIDGHTRATRAPSTTRSAHPVALAGVAHEIAGGAAIIGVSARAGREVETGQIVSVGEPVLITRLNGYAEPTRITLAHNQLFQRRRQNETRAISVAGSGRARGWTWAADVEMASFTERQWSQNVQDPATDEWDATSYAAGGMLQRMLSSALFTVSARWQRSHGEARTAESDTVIFEATESTVTTGADVRWQAGRKWTVRTAAAVGYDRRDRGDTAQAALRTRLQGRSFRIETEIAHAPTARLTLAGGIARTTWAGRGSAPSPRNFPVPIQPLVGPETALHAAPNSTNAISLGVRFQATTATALRVTGRYQSLSPKDNGVTYEMQPSGTRRTWAVEVSAVLRQMVSPSGAQSQGR